MAVSNPFDAPNLDEVDLFSDEYLRSPVAEDQSIFDMDEMLEAKTVHKSKKKKKDKKAAPPPPTSPKKATPKKATPKKAAPKKAAPKKAAPKRKDVPEKNKRATKVQKFVRTKSTTFYTEHTQAQREAFLGQKHAEITYEDIPRILSLGVYFEIAPSAKPKVDLDGRLTPLEQVVLASKLVQEDKPEVGGSKEIEW